MVGERERDDRKTIGQKRHGGQRSQGHTSGRSLWNEWEGEDSEGHGRRVAGTGRRATSVRGRDGGERRNRRKTTAGSEGPGRESVYRLWRINSRAVSKSPRSAESLWIGAKTVH